ncbi:699_t:CDS:1 [Ambispora gerdemannii]|uniref:699_t:CDS:1 n=1 Tax=Ambispora gerdemannii TaxID=144530 RepID=A0A9N9G5J3_9GLOM|nr:699_t:CDS:1 [Ambispora gerdemannii]
MKDTKNINKNFKCYFQRKKMMIESVAAIFWTRRLKRCLNKGGGRFLLRSEFQNYSTLIREKIPQNEKIESRIFSLKESKDLISIYSLSLLELYIFRIMVLEFFGKSHEAIVTFIDCLEKKIRFSIRFHYIIRDKILRNDGYLMLYFYNEVLKKNIKIGDSQEAVSAKIDNALKKHTVENIYGYYQRLKKTTTLHQQVYDEILDRFAAYPEYEKIALECYEEMKVLNYFPCTYTCNRLLRRLSETIGYGFDKEVPVIYVDMMEYGRKPNLATFNILMGFYARRRNYNNFWRIYQLLREANLEANKITYQIILKILEQPLPHSQLIANTIEHLEKLKIKPDERTLNALLAGFGNIGDVIGAGKVLDMYKIHSIVPSINTYNILLKNLLTFGLTRMAVKIYEQMLKNGPPPDLITYNLVLNIYTREKHLRYMKYVNMAEDVLNTMLANKVYPDIFTCNMLLIANSRRSRVDGIKKILEIMLEQQLYPNVHTLSIFIHIFVKAGKVKTARQLYTKLIENARFKHEKKAHAIMSTNLIHGYLHYYQDFVTAESLFQDMIENRIIPTIITFNTLIYAYTHRSTLNIKKAIKLFTEMETKYKVAPDAATFHHMITGYMAIGEVDKALEVYYEMYRRGIKPSDTVLSRIHFEINYILMGGDKAKEEKKSKDSINIETIETKDYTYIEEKETNISIIIKK